MKIQCSFAIAGLTQPELRSVQLLIDLVRSVPEKAEMIAAWLEGAVDELRSQPGD